MAQEAEIYVTIEKDGDGGFGGGGEEHDMAEPRPKKFPRTSPPRRPATPDFHRGRASRSDRRRDDGGI